MSKLSIKKINYFFSNLNVVVILVGYPLIVSIFIPLTGGIEGSSQVITIPFRIVSLGITLIALFLNIRNTVKFPVYLKLFFFFWTLVLIRIFSDFEIRTDYYVLTEDKNQIWIMAIIFCFIPMISLAKSFKIIDFNLCLKYIYWSLNLVLIIFFLSSIGGTSSEDRAKGNLALDEISFAQSAISTVILSIYLLVSKKNTRLLTKTVYIISIILGFYVALRTGSKGPLVAFFVVLFFWYSFKDKSYVWGWLKFISLISMTFILQSVILFIISIVSPLTFLRIDEALNGKDMSVRAREESYNWFLDNILEDPLFGSHFARLGYWEYPGYAHNILLDISLGFGLFGLVLFLSIIFKAIRNLRYNLISNHQFWIGLIMLQFLVLSMTSGSYYSDPVLNCSIVLSLLMHDKRIIKYK